MSTKAFTRTVSDFYTSVRPGCSIFNKNIDEIEDKLFDILPVNAQYTVNMFNTPYAISMCPKLYTSTKAINKTMPLFKVNYLLRNEC